MSDGYKHYVRPSTDGIIRYGFCDVQEEPHQGDILIDDNAPRQFNRPLMNDKQQYIYKLENSAIVFRTQAELDAEMSAIPPQPPSLQDQVLTMQQVINSLLGV